MKTKIFLTLPLATLALAACSTMDDGMDDGMSSNTTMASSDIVVQVGGADMFANRTIVQNAVNSPIHTTLVKAVQAAGLVDTLSGTGPFTVFAPTDAAFGKVPAATVNSLMQPENKAALSKVLTYHVVPGRITAADVASRIRAGGGTATYTTVEGEPLTFSMMGSRVMIRSMGGSMAHVTQADVMQSNGVIHVVDGVLLPSM